MKNIKRVIAFAVTICMAATCFACFALPVSAAQEPETVYNLATQDSTITHNDANGFTAEATFDDNGVLTVKAAGAWPNVAFEYAVPYTFDIAKATLRVKFELKGGGTSIRLLSTETGENDEPYDIYVHHFTEGSTFDTAGDLVTPGVYELEIPFSNLAFCDYTAEANYVGKLPIEVEELTLTGLVIYSINGAEVVIEKLEVVVEGDEIVDVSEETSEEPSKEPSEETSKPDTPPTGDNGFIALAVISTISLAGAVIIKKRGVI